MPSLANYGPAIAATTAALQQLIASVTPQVTGRTLDAARNGIGGPSINVFLYRDELLVYREGSDPSRLGHVIAELQYLVSALPGDEADVDALSQRAYGAARAAIQRNPVISASVGADGPMEVRLTTTALSLGDVASLWTASEVPFRLSFGVTATFALTADGGHSVLAGVREVMTRARPGLIVVFSGADTTAKTDAVITVAEGIGLPMITIALDQVVSKYIEETEKNLRRVFDAAEDGGALLYFDEADALFGRRTEIPGDDDRYANLELGHILDVLESAPGPVVIGLDDEAGDELAGRVSIEVRFPSDPS